MSKTVLIDGHSILNRAYYGIPLLSNSAGMHTNAIYGFLNIMFKVMDEEHPDHLVVAFDVHAPTFRHKMYPEYKGTRHPMPEELKEQVPVIKKLLIAMNITVIEKAGYEADDIIGTLSRLYESRGEDVSIISGDRDLLQLATEKTLIRIPKTKSSGTEIEDYHAEDVKEKYGVTPSEFIDMKALMGDTSDNVPGIPGIGEKTASKIISSWHNIETAYEHADEIKPRRASENLKTYYEQAVFSKVLVTIKTDCDLDFDPDSAIIDNMMNERSYTILKKLELKKIIDRFGGMQDKIESSINKCRIIESIDECDLILSNADSSSKKYGMFYISSEDFEGLAIYGNMTDPVSHGPEEAVFIPAHSSSDRITLRDIARQIVQKAGSVWFMDLKSQLPIIKLNRSDRAYDASVAAYLLNPLADNYDYDTLAENFLDITIPSYSDLFKKMNISQAWKVSRDKVLQYLAYQAAVPFLISEKLTDSLQEKGMSDLYRNIEMPIVYVLYDMEKYGIRVEKQELESYGRALISRIDELEQGIYDLAGEIFNINSPKQLGHILFEKMNLPYARKTKTGYSTSADVLEKLRDKDPIAGMILEYRQLTKLKSTYADGLAGYIRPDDHRIHCKFNQTITATGRLSSADPNLQNIPVRMELGRLIRKVFVPEDGMIFVDADYSQIELRVLAHMAGDENLINAYKEDQDIHRITAAKVFHVPFEDVTPQLRRSAKAVNFGIVYGISSFGLSQDLGIGRKEAQEYINQYFRTYPGIKHFLDKCVEDAKKTGYAVTMYGRRRPIPELSSKNFAQRNFGERAAMNSPIQGTAADIIKIAMIRVNDRLQRENMKSRLILQIHDELLIEAVPEEVEEVKNILKEEMCGAAELKVPLEVDMHTGYSWYDLK